MSYAYSHQRPWNLCIGHVNNGFTCPKIDFWKRTYFVPLFLFLYTHCYGRILHLLARFVHHPWVRDNDLEWSFSKSSAFIRMGKLKSRLFLVEFDHLCDAVVCVISRR